MDSGLKVDLGGVVIQLDNEADVRLVPADHYQAFLTSGKPDVCLKIFRAQHPLLPFETPDFSTRHWMVKNDAGMTRFFLHMPQPSGETVKYLLNMPDNDNGVLEFESSQDSFPVFLHYFDSWLITYLLSRKRGLLFHSCGVDLNGKGILFVGESGAGKSTTARLWREYGHPSAKLMGEERIAIRNSDNTFVMQATPWYATESIARTHPVACQAIFILKHGKGNQIDQITPSQALKKLIPRIYFPFWNAKDMDNSMDRLTSLCSSVPIYDFGFTPDVRAVEAVWEWIGS